MKRRSLIGAGLAASGLGALPAVAAQTFGRSMPQYDVIIVGSGAAGLAAAVSAREHGAGRVAVLEKAPTIGGHTILSTGYVSAVPRMPDNPQAYEKSCRSMLEGMRATAGTRPHSDMARKLVYESGQAVEWLESLGMRWESTVYQTLGGLEPRSFISSSVRAGYDYVTTLNQAARRLGVDVYFNTCVKRLLTDETGRVNGLTAEVKQHETVFTAGAVVLATGGYGANVKMRMQYVPLLDESFSTTADPYNKGTDTCTGEGIVMAQAIGADVVDMDCIQFIPFWGGRLTDYVGADIYLNERGRRFVNEGAPWKRISAEILKLPERRCWVITDSQSVQGASRSSKIMSGVVRVAQNVHEMAAGMGVRSEMLVETLERYNGFVRAGHDADFGKTMFTQQINRPPFYYGLEKLYVHYCCGGLAIDDRARVLDGRGNPIAGLFAAGEVTGGVHGEDRLGGCSLPDCLVFGKEAGRGAADCLRQS